MTKEQFDKSKRILNEIEQCEMLVQDCSAMLDDCEGITITAKMSKTPAYMRNGLEINHKELSLTILRKIKKSYEEYLISLQETFAAI